MSGIDSFKIQLGLPQLPDESISPELYGQLLPIYRALQNLLRGTSQYCGIDAPDSSLWSELTYQDTLLESQLTRLYPIASVAINRGQVVNLFNSAGVLNARLAQATSAATMMHGVANTAAAPGQRFEMYWMRALLDSIGGLTIGQLYYLSTVAGAVQSARPAAAGNIIQSAGLALAGSTFLMDCTLQYIQL